MASSLLDNFTETWAYNETSGPRYSALRGATLTPYAGATANPAVVSRVAGKTGHGFAAHFERADSAYFATPAARALELGYESPDGWYIWAWVRIGSAPTTNFPIANKARFGEEWLFSIYSAGPFGMVQFRAGNMGVNAYSYSGHFTGADVGVWCLVEAWYDPVANVVAVAKNRGTPDTVTPSSAGPVPQPAMPATIAHDGTSYFDGDMHPLHIRKQAPTEADRDLVWNAGAGSAYPFQPPSVSSIEVTVDNTGGSSPIMAGSPLPLFLPETFPWFGDDAPTLAYPNGDDLTATGPGDEPLALWPERVDQGNRYGRVWVASPAVEAGGAVTITLHMGDPDQFSTLAYDEMFTKRTPDAATVALYQCDEVAGALTPEAGGGTDMALVGAPVLADTDGGNFRVSEPAQAFADGGYLTLDGSTQYATVAGLLDTPPDEGSIGFWCRFGALPEVGTTVACKANSYTGGTITDGLVIDFPYFAHTMSVRMFEAGVTVADLQLRIYRPGFTTLDTWMHWVISWGTKVELRINGYKWAEAPHVGGWGAGTDAPFCLGARYLGSASGFAPMAFDEVEVRDVQPDRVDVLGWFNRGGVPQPYEYDRWQRSDTPVIVGGDEAIAIEPRLVRLAEGQWVGCVTGDNFHPLGGLMNNLYKLSSEDGLTITKGGRIMGNGTGGHAGNAMRPSILNDDGTLYLYFSDQIHTTDGIISWATTDDDGETWTKQGVLVAPDAAHIGYANTAVVKVGDTYHFWIEYKSALDFDVVHFTADSATGPLTLVDDRVTSLTLRQGAGSVSTGGVVYENGRYHFFPHMARPASYPSAIYHGVSTDGVHWDVRGGADPNFELAEFGTFPLMDQVADAYVYFNPDSTPPKVCCLYDIDDNHTTLDAACFLATFDGTLADLAHEYPQLVLGSAIVPPGPPPTPSAGTGAALLMVA